MDELLSKQLPMSTEAEQSVIGSMLVNPNCISEVIELLHSDDFYVEENRRIFEIIYQMFNEAARIDPVTVLDRLKLAGLYDEAGGRAYHMQLMDVTPTSAHVSDYAAIVRDKSLLRAIAQTAGEIQATALAGEGDAAYIAELAEQRIYNIRHGREVKGLIPLKSALLDLYAMLDERSKSDSDIPGISTGFHELDRQLTGLNKSDLILVAARPGMGKTAFALNLALNGAKASQKDVVVFQLEMSRDQLASRFLSSQAMVDSQKLKTGSLDQDDWMKIARASNVLSKLRIYVDDNPAITVAEIKAKCRRLGDGLGMIVIDYIQLMQSGGKRNENRVQEVAEISRSLKIMAKELTWPG